MKPDSTFNLIDLLEDASFIASVNQPSLESEAHWQRLLGEGKIAREDYLLAISLIRMLRPSYPHLSAEDINTMWKNIREKQIRKRNYHRLLYRWLSVAAACAAIVAGLFVIHTLPIENTLDEQSLAFGLEDVARPVNVGNDIQIVFSDNKQIALKEKTAEIIYNKSGEATVNSQVAAQSVERRDVYNQIVVPNGKQVSLTLSDGSRLYLNASSRVVYPPVFGVDKREIYIEGEAYADVAPESERPFVLKTNRMEINVKGTAFNVSAYDDEASQTVVLVHGSVSVKTKADPENENTLLPNQMLRLTDNQTQLEYVNVDQYISWKDGFYLFKEEQFSFIINRLSHYYGIHIRYSPPIGNLKFTGKLDLKDNPERVLEGILKSATTSLNLRKDNEIYYLEY